MHGCRDLGHLYKVLVRVHLTSLNYNPKLPSFKTLDKCYKVSNRRYAPPTTKENTAPAMVV